MKNTIYLESIDPKRNRHRWYRIDAELTLFGGVVRREWGRVGQKGRRVERTLESYQEAVLQIKRIMDVRKKHGYKVLRSSVSF
ncbi:MAG: WGR domain-containing protein [Thermodesulfobacteriota bacterium]|nr:WGR domain-containing protein [Thermodesulfobacteriota bacterium]